MPSSTSTSSTCLRGSARAVARSVRTSSSVGTGIEMISKYDGVALYRLCTSEASVGSAERVVTAVFVASSGGVASNTSGHLLRWFNDEASRRVFWLSRVVSCGLDDTNDL